MNEIHRQDMIERNARNALASSGTSTRGERGSAIVYYMGTFDAPMSPTPGLLLQLEGEWVFGARTPMGSDVVLHINPNAVVDLNTVEERLGTVLIIRFDPQANDSDQLDFLVAGSDSASSAIQIVYALSKDAGLMDHADQPTAEWKARIAVRSQEADIPTGIGYLQGAVPTARSGVYSIVGESEVVRGMGEALDALEIDWDDVEEYWLGEMDYPDFFPRASGRALVFTLDKAVHRGYDLVIHPFGLAAWLAKLDEEGFEID